MSDVYGRIRAAGAAARLDIGVCREFAAIVVSRQAVRRRRRNAFARIAGTLAGRLWRRSPRTLGARDDGVGGRRARPTMTHAGEARQPGQVNWPQWAAHAGKMQPSAALTPSQVPWLAHDLQQVSVQPCWTPPSRHIDW